MAVPPLKPIWGGNFSKRVQDLRIHNNAETFSEDRYEARMVRNRTANRSVMDATFKLIESDCPPKP